MNGSVNSRSDDPNEYWGVKCYVARIYLAVYRYPQRGEAYGILGELDL